MLSILIAFSLDAWWDRRVEARVEQAHLRALESDFEQNVARLEQLIEREGRIMAASRRLLDESPARRAILEDSIGYFFGQVFNSGRFDPLMGAYQAVVSSGGLSQVRDVSLRLALADFASLLASRYTERYADELYMDFIRRFTGRLGITAAVTETDTDGRSQTASRRGLLQDPTFRSTWRSDMWRSETFGGRTKAFTTKRNTSWSLPAARVADGAMGPDDPCCAVGAGATLRAPWRRTGPGRCSRNASSVRSWTQGSVMDNR